MTDTRIVRVWDVTWSCSWQMAIGLAWEHQTFAVALGPFWVYVRRKWAYR